MVDNDWAMQVASFRFGVIAELVGGTQLSWGEKTRLLKEKTARSYNIPGSGRSSVSIPTILGWIKKYKEGGCRIDSLKPRRRRDYGRYRKLDDRIRMAIRDLKAENSQYTVPVLIGKLRALDIIGSHDEISRPTIYRFLAKEEMGRTSPDAADRRRFEADHSNEIWQCDVMHGPKVFGSDGKVRKSYLLGIMDDHSRMIIHARFYESENFDTLKSALRESVQRRGLATKFYVDNGACYRAGSLEQITAALGIQLIHSRPYTPQGRGKIERWFRYVREDFLPRHNFSDMTFDEINAALEAWVAAYNDRLHSVTKITPNDRYMKNLECVRYAPTDLDKYFRKIVTRMVRKDRCVQLDNRVFEVHHGLIDRNVELAFHPEDPEIIEVLFEGRSYGMATYVDASVNKRVGRESYTNDKVRPSELLERAPMIATGGLFEEVGDYDFE